MQEVICVDIDGTIATVCDNYADCEPIDGSREALSYLRKKGYRIHLHTGRHLDHAELTQEWLAKHGFEYDLLVMGKPPAKYYVDDRAIRFETWPQVLRVIDPPKRY